MKPLGVLFLVWTAVFAAGAAQAAGGRVQPGQPGDFGAGVILGSPTGLSLKYWLSDTRALDGSLAWKFGTDDRVEMTVDHLWHIPIPDVDVPGRLPFYIGMGLRVLAGEDSEAGVRIPLGVSWLLPKAPLELFAEVAPVIRFAPDTGGDVDGGIGIRYYFTP